MKGNLQMNKSNEIYKEAFDKALIAVLRELKACNYNSLADLMLFSDYMLNRTCSLGDGRIMSQREFYNSVEELPKECKTDYENYLKCTLKLINMSEWLQHISDVLKQTQDTEDLLERICDFDFKFDTILQ